MAQKKVNFQQFYDLTDEYPYYAFNSLGILHGFKNPPIRDFSFQEWIDSVDGSTGTIINFLKWDVSVRNFADLTDLTFASPGVRKKMQALITAEEVAEKRKELDYVNGKKPYPRARRSQAAKEACQKRKEEKNALN